MSAVVWAFAQGRAGLSWLVRLLRQPLFANAAYLEAVTLLGAATGFVFWGLAARLYTPEQVGTASAVISVTALLSGIAGLGVGMGLVRFLPEARDPQRLLNTAFTFNVSAALIVGGLYLAGLKLWSPSLASLRENAVYACSFLVFVVAQTVVLVVQAAFVARRRAGYALAQNLVIYGGRLLPIALLVGLGAAGLVGSLALSTLLAFLLSLTFFLPKVEAGYHPRPDSQWFDLVAILPYSMANYLAGLMAQTPQTLMPVLILELLGPAAGGYAYIAWMLGAALAGPGLALAGSAFAEGSNAPGSLRRILSRAAVAGLALTVAGAVIVALGAPWLLHLFGAGYAAEAAGLLRWLAAAAPLVVLANLYFTQLRVQKRVGRLIALSAVIAVTTLGLAAALMPRYGLAASAVGWLLGNGLVAAIGLIGVGKARIIAAKRELGWR